MKIMVPVCLGLVLVGGCSKENASEKGSTEKPQPAIKKLLARTDEVLVKHFYTKAGVSEDKDPKYSDIYPGSVSITPIWVYEPGKEKDGDRGAQIEVTASWLPSSSGGTRQPDSSVSFLDLDEMKDLDNALSFLGGDASPWRSSTTQDHIEVMFSAKDAFQVAAFKSDADKEEVLFFKAGGTDASIALTKLPDFKTKLEAAVQLLESK